MDSRGTLRMKPKEDVKLMIEPGEKTRENGGTTMEREVGGCQAILFYSSTYIMVDLFKQTATYGMKYYNKNYYPIPQTLAVTVTEILKFLIFAIALLVTKQCSKVKLSLYYAVPSLIYAINNNVYYAALRFTTPPIWNIIIQLRIPFTGIAYNYIFKRPLAPVQWMALLLLMISVIFTNFVKQNVSDDSDGNMAIALTLAVFGSILSVTGTVTMEYLFKNDKRSFSEKQMQLYMFGMVMSFFLYVAESHSLDSPGQLEAEEDHVYLVYSLLCVAIVMSIGVGLSVAFIVKKLDNIVKLYTQALANMFTSGACAFLFPDRFQVSVLFMVCLVLMITAVFLYENPDLKTASYMDFFRKPELRFKFLFVIIATPISLALGILYSSQT